MNIGEKIRDLRVAKLMTQSELAGTQITRNMLSCIENGTAKPSLSTIVYLAGRLNVPTGFLLADEGDEAVYRKMTGFANIKQAYAAGDWQGCRSLCRSCCPEPDDELCLILADCDTEIAIAEFWRGRLHSACRFFDEALSYASKTMYRTEHIRAQAEVYFRYMQRISATLYSDMLDEATPLTCQYVSGFSGYLHALEEMENGALGAAQNYLETADENSFFAAHIRIRCHMNEKAYEVAKRELLTLLNAETPLNEVELYAVLYDLEICCRETDDYKQAYYYANEKLQLLEQLLKEI